VDPEGLSLAVAAEESVGVLELLAEVSTIDVSSIQTFKSFLWHSLETNVKNSNVGPWRDFVSLEV